MNSAIHWKTKDVMIRDIKLLNNIILSHLHISKFYTCLWAIVELPNKDREIQCFVFEIGRDEVWSYRVIPISSGPFYYGCPKHFLDFVPPKSNISKFEISWREIINLP